MPFAPKEPLTEEIREGVLGLAKKHSSEDEYCKGAIIAFQCDKDDAWLRIIGNYIWMKYGENGKGVN